MNLLKEYLIHSYIYYELDNNIITDDEYDRLCQSITEDWENLDGPYSDLVCYEQVSVGSGYDYVYPDEIVYEAQERLTDHLGLKGFNSRGN